MRDALSALQDAPDSINLSEQRLEYRQEAANATAFANAKSKIYYNRRHHPLMLKRGDYAYLRLHQGYQLPERPNRKVLQQRCGPFLVKRRVGRLVYELDLPPTWLVHPVISVAQLEPTPDGTDPYQRPRPDHPPSVETEGDTEHFKSYEVEKLVKKRVRKYGRTPVTQYMVRWLGYGPEYDEWRSISALSDCLELVEQFETTNPIIQPANARCQRKLVHRQAAHRQPVTSITQTNPVVRIPMRAVKIPTRAEPTRALSPACRTGLRPRREGLARS